MKTTPLAFSVHLLTASGAALALMALVAATQGNWQLMFGWLVVALVVDGVDGPLARRFDTKKNAPNWDGALLDLVVDYLTYVFIPAYALIASGILSSPWGLVAALLVALTGVVYFADVRMKNPDQTFSGFPAAWQMVLLVFLTLPPPQPVTFAVIVALAVAQFFPLKFIHPVRTERWREVNLPMTLAWLVFAAWSAYAGFEPPLACQVGLVVTSVWILCVGIVMQVLPVRRRAPSES
jgi:phosphatidylcholine synthase